jgi:hypothetical protein
MRIWYDCEFVENGRTIDLVSIGMVTEDGRALYRVLDEPNVISRAVARPWLRDNVIKHLPVRLEGDCGAWAWDREHADWPKVTRRGEVRADVQLLIASTPEPELWAWYGAYDHVCYAQLFGRMIDLPPGFPMWTNDLRQEVQRLGNPQLPEGNQAEHHALADAFDLRDRHLWLERHMVAHRSDA